MSNLNLSELLDSDYRKVHDNVERSINDKIREFYPNYTLRVVLDENNPFTNFYAHTEKAGEGYLTLSGTGFIRLVYGILSDKDLSRFKPALKLILDHEARHIINGPKFDDELDAQLYALSKAKDPINVLSMQLAMRCYLIGNSPEESISRQLRYWGHHTFKSNIDFPIKEEAKRKIIKRTKSYLDYLSQKRSAITAIDLGLSQNVIPWSQTYL